MPLDGWPLSTRGPGEKGRAGQALARHHVRSGRPAPVRRHDGRWRVAQACAPPCVSRGEKAQVAVPSPVLHSSSSSANPPSIVCERTPACLPQLPWCDFVLFCWDWEDGECSCRSRSDQELPSGQRTRGPTWDTAPGHNTALRSSSEEWLHAFFKERSGRPVNAYASSLRKREESLPVHPHSHNRPQDGSQDRNAASRRSRGMACGSGRMMGLQPTGVFCQGAHKETST